MDPARLYEVRGVGAEETEDFISFDGERDVIHRSDPGIIFPQVLDDDFFFFRQSLISHSFWPVAKSKPMSPTPLI